MKKKLVSVTVFFALVLSFLIPLTMQPEVKSSATVYDDEGYKKYNKLSASDTFQNGDNICFGMQFEKKGSMPEQKYSLVAPNYMLDTFSRESKPFTSDKFVDTANKVVEKIVGKYNYIIEYKTSNKSDGFYIKFRDRDVTYGDEDYYLNVVQRIAYEQKWNEGEVGIGGFAGRAFATRPMVLYTNIKNEATVFHKDGDLIYTNYTTNITQNGVPITLSQFTQQEIALLRDAAKTDIPCYTGNFGSYSVVSYEDPELPEVHLFKNERMVLCATNNQDKQAVLNYFQNKQATQKQIYGSLGTGLSVVNDIYNKDKYTVNQYTYPNGDKNDYSVIVRQVAKIDIFREAPKHTIHMGDPGNGRITLESDGNAQTSYWAFDFVVYDMSDVKFTFTPDDKYSFVSCLLNGISVRNGGTMNITRDMTGITTFELLPVYTMKIDKSKITLPTIFKSDLTTNIGKKVGKISITNTGNRDIHFNGTQDIEFVRLFLPESNVPIAVNQTLEVDIAINDKAVLGLNEKTIQITNTNGQSVALTVSILLESHMGIDKSNFEFGELEYKSTAISQNLIVSNLKTISFTFGLSKEPSFFVVNDIPTLPVYSEGSATLSIIPKPDLKVGEYNESITIVNHFGDTATFTLHVNIKKASVIAHKLITSPIDTYRYNGTAQYFGIENMTTDFYKVIISEKGSTASVKAINAGIYNVTFTLNDPANYRWKVREGFSADESLRCEVKIFINTKNVWETDLSMDNYLAGATPATPSIKSKFGEVTFKYFKDDVLLTSAPTTAGDYRVVAIVDNCDNYNGLTKEVKFKVIASALVTFYVDGVPYGDAQRVELHTNATMPTPPTKANVGEFQYTFLNWDKSLENIQADTDINAVFSEKEVHTLDHITSVDSTCTTVGNIEYWKCRVCGKYFKDALATIPTTEAETVIPKTNTLDHITSVDSTCTTVGNIEYWKCRVCGKYFKDALATIPTTEAETVIPVKEHEFEKTWSKDEKNHWHGCAHCSEIKDKATHIWDNGSIITAPTIEHDGLKTYKCLCNATKNEIIAKLVATDKEISNNNISVYGKMTEGVELIVTSIKDTENYNKFLAMIGENNVKLGDYLISITNGSFIGNLKITFNVDSKYNGKTIMILQQKADGQIEIINAVAENGKVSTSVTELSSFMLAGAKDTTNNVSGCKSKTSDIGGNGFLIICSLTTLAFILKRKSI